MEGFMTLRPGGRLPKAKLYDPAPPDAVKTTGVFPNGTPVVPMLTEGNRIDGRLVAVLTVMLVVLAHPDALATVTEYVPDALTTAVPAFMSWLMMPPDGPANV